MNDFPSMTQRFDPNGGQVQFGDDTKLYVEFSQRTDIDGAASKEAGRPVYKAVDYVRIQQPGERDAIIRPCHGEDIQRFPRQWQAFQNKTQDIPEGTPIATLFPANPEIVENLKYFKVHTAEQLVALNDTQLQGLGMGGRAFQERAKQFIAASEKGKGFHALQKQIDGLAQQRAADAQKIQALEAALAVAQADKDRGKAA